MYKMLIYKNEILWYLLLKVLFDYYWYFFFLEVLKEIGKFVYSCNYCNYKVNGLYYYW